MTFNKQQIVSSLKSFKRPLVTESSADSSVATNHHLLVTLPTNNKKRLCKQFCGFPGKKTGFKTLSWAFCICDSLKIKSLKEGNQSAEAAKRVPEKDFFATSSPWLHFYFAVKDSGSFRRTDLV